MQDAVEKLIASFISEGGALAKLLSNARTLANKEKTDQAKQEMLNNIHDEVAQHMSKLLKDIDGFQIPASFPDKVIPRVLGKIETTLQEFAKLDHQNASGYKEHVKKVAACKSRKQSSAVSSVQTRAPKQSESPAADSTQLQPPATFDNPQVDQLANLDDVDKQCLFCFCLFPAEEEVKKREPIHLWIGMGFVDGDSKGVDVLSKLVAEGFVERIIGNKKLYNRYKINEIVRNMVIKALDIDIISNGLLSIMDKSKTQTQQKHHQQQQPPPPSQGSQQQPTLPLDQEPPSPQPPKPQQQQHQQQHLQPLPPQQQQPTTPSSQDSQQQPTLPLDQEPPSPQQPQPQQQQKPSQQPRKPQRMFSLIPPLGRTQHDTDMSETLVLNLGVDSLQAKTLEHLSKSKKNVKVLHLGSWKYNDSRRYIVVEEVEVLKTLTKHMGQVTFFSLQGISGIVELPDSVYKLENLKVLDLRACPNLESLSEGIESLRNLTHLDLSECYLLDHIPKGIANLTQLRVLKGFVINPEEPQVEKGKGEGNENVKNASSSALFSDLSNLTKLVKLTIRTREKSFPNDNDFDTLNNMINLTSLRIAWVQSPGDEMMSTTSKKFPKSLKKLELQAAPEDTLSLLLRLVSEDTENSLEKLYIRGGQLWSLGLEMHQFSHVHSVRLRYLPELHIDWDEFRKFFPKLSRLEVSGCPNVLFFPCDENGVWEET